MDAVNPFPFLVRAWDFFLGFPPCWIFAGAIALGVTLKQIFTAFDPPWRHVIRGHSIEATKLIPLWLLLGGAIAGALILPWWVASTSTSWLHTAPTFADRLKAMFAGTAIGASAIGLWDYLFRPLGMRLINLLLLLAQKRWSSPRQRAQAYPEYPK